MAWRLATRVRFYVRPHWILIVAVAPLVLLGLLGTGVALYALVRYDPAYFTPAYRELYGTPAATAKALEHALKTGDEALLAELEGLRSPADLETASSIEFVMLWEYTDRYMTYLYFDPQSYQPHRHYFQRVRGRWVVAPPDLYYYVRSGHWHALFLPAAATWWGVGGGLLAVLWLIRSSPRVRALVYGDWVLD